MVPGEDRSQWGAYERGFWARRPGKWCSGRSYISFRQSGGQRVNVFRDFANNGLMRTMAIGDEMPLVAICGRGAQIMIDNVVVRKLIPAGVE